MRCGPGDVIQCNHNKDMAMKNQLLPGSLALALGLGLGLTALRAADVRQGLVSYYPLDTMSGDWSTTPDLVGGNHLTLWFLDPSALVAGKRGQAMSFDGATQYAMFTTEPGVDTGLPISRHPSFTIALWVKGVGTGQSDRRAFSESNSLDSNNNPLVNIGTHNAGTDGTVDLFFRNSTGGVQLNHLHSTAAGFDGEWHHIALVDVNGAVTLYIDGVQDLTPTYTRGTFAQDTTSIGAIVRGLGANVGAYFAGAIDDVALWERALTAAEIQAVMNNGIQTPVPTFAPTITQHPSGATDLWVGDTYTLRAGASGTRPLTYEWYKGDALVPGANGPTLTLTDLKASDSGEYRLQVSNAAGTTSSAAAVLQVGAPPAPNLTNGVLAYWPLDEVQGTKTPDVARGFDLDLVNLTAADVKPGKWGNCFEFNLDRQTMLTRIHAPGEALPMYQHPNFSVSLWVKGAIQSDKRVFSEGSTKNTQPLFNIGTHNTGADGTVDSYIRTDTGATSGDHRHSTGIAFDDTWHHIAYVQREISGVMTAVMYIDGMLDDIVLGPVRPLTLDTTTIGGILRATPSAWFTGQIDDVVIWNRALSEAEVQLLATAVMPTPPAEVQPLAINLFKPDLPAVAAGDSVTLRWDVSKSATQITITPGLGDVTAQTIAGAGNRTVTPDQTTTYTLTIQRGAEILTAQTTVTVIDGVAANWTLVDNFDRYTVGPLSATGWWRDLRGDFAQVEDLQGNRLLSIRSTDSAALLALGSLRITEGQQRTLFFRMMPRGQPTAALQHILGLTDKNIRAYGDAESNIGPVFYANHDTTLVDWFPGVRNGVGSPIEYGLDPLARNAVYAVWIDIRNVPMSDPASPYDIFSVYLQKEGDAARTTLFTEYLSDRDPFTPDVILGAMTPDLDKLFVAGNNTGESAWFDDFYLSKSGYNNTLPRAFGYSEPVGGQAPSLTIARSGAEVEVAWTAGVLEAAPAVNGPWSAVEGATSPHKTAPAEGARFYRARR